MHFKIDGHHIELRLHNVDGLLRILSTLGIMALIA